MNIQIENGQLIREKRMLEAELVFTKQSLEQRDQFKKDLGILGTTVM